MQAFMDCHLHKTTYFYSCQFVLFVFVFLVCFSVLPALPLEGGAGGGLWSSWSLLQTLNSIRVLDDFDGVALHLAAGNKLELGLVAEVAEVLAGIPADVHGLDVACAEFLGGVCAFATKFHTETAKFAKADDVAGQELFAEATNHVGDDAADGAFGKRGVVIRHVLDELVVGEFGVSLSGTISLGAAGLCADVGLLRAGLRAHDTDGIVDHFCKV